jgi:5-methylthioribose kinase
MRYIETPHIILRNALMQGLRFSTFAYDISIFLAKTLYYSSAFAMSGSLYRSNVSYWAKNHSLCTLTEQVVFTDPYKIALMNHWTTPQLDNFAEGVRNDYKLKIAANHLKNKFLSSTQALIHADLHTGSVMVKEGSTFVIDPEFAFYGPMGFDIGAIIANLLLSYYSQSATNGKDYSEWILTQINILYNSFFNKFLEIWNENAINEKMVNIEVLKGDSLTTFQNDFMKKIWSDSIGFAGMKMIRRVIGIAHVADLDSIKDDDIRSNCEKRVLALGRKLILFSSQDNNEMNTIEKLTNLARNYYDMILNEYPNDI